MPRVRWLARATIVVAFLLGHAAVLRAQAVEFTPVAGYRFGGDFFELVTASSIDRDGAPAMGAVVDVPLAKGLQFEGFFTHQSADVLAPTYVSGPQARWRIVVDHFQGGGLQEFGGGSVRPFLTGALGLSRYSTAGDNELRFSLGGGGGVKLFPWSSVGLRLDMRVFATFVDFSGSLVACGPGFCAVDLHTATVWQAEFTAGMVVRLR